MARKTDGKVTDTAKRLLALEQGQHEVKAELVGANTRLETMTEHLARHGATLTAITTDLAAIRTDVNVGLGKLLAGLDRLHDAIDRSATVRGEVAALAERITRLEGKTS